MKKFILAGLCFIASLVSVNAQWTSISNYPSTAADGLVSFSINGKGYVGGGNANKKFYMYDPSTNVWTSKADIPGPPSRAWSGHFTYNNMAYVLGGDSSFGGLVKDMWAYDPSTNVWTEKADFPGGLRDGMFAWVIGNKVYVGGGFDGINILSDFYSYDPAMDSWSSLGNMPYAVLFASTFVLNNQGYATLWEGGGFFNKLLRYDPATDTWDEKTACPAAARGEGVGFAINGLGYAGLGQTNFTQSYKDFYSYNPANDSWSTTDVFPVANTGWSTSFVIGNDAYVGTGTDLPDFNYTNKFYKHTFSNSSGIDQLKNTLAFDVFPNVVERSITIQSSEQLNKVELYTIYGERILLSVLENKQTVEIDLSQLSVGIYLLYAYSDHQTGIKKVIKK